MERKRFTRILLTGAIIGMIGFTAEAQTVVSDKLIKTKMSDKDVEIHSINDNILNGNYKVYRYGDDYELVSFKDGVKDGAVSIYSYEDGLKAKGNYINGSAEGEWLFYDEKEDVVLYSRSYKNGKPDGTWREYDRRIKTPMKEDVYKDGLIVETREYNSNGSLKSESLYKDGLRTGNWTVFYSQNNTLRSSTNYVLNVKEGKYEAFYNNGNIERRGNYENNKPIGEWIIYYSKDGSIYCRQMLKDSKWDFEAFHDNGNLKEKGVALNFNLSIYEGTYTEYYSNGKMKEERNYLNGTRHGKYKVYREDGTLSQEGLFHMGDRTEYKRYDENGKPL